MAATRRKAEMITAVCLGCACTFSRIAWRMGLFCSRRCYLSHPQRTHGGVVGHIKTPEYIAWQNIKRRCLVPSHRQYLHYGGRGITIYAPWIEDFGAFLEHVGKRPTSDHTIERIDNNKGYEPGNLTWATQTQQLRNRRTNAILVVNGVARCFSEWAELSGVPYSQIRNRVRLGWPPEKCIDKQRHDRTPHIITVDGVTMNTEGWANRLGTNPWTIRKRLELGWNERHAVTEPVRQHVRGQAQQHGS